jgi:hypothetical protein
MKVPLPINDRQLVAESSHPELTSTQFLNDCYW